MDMRSKPMITAGQLFVLLFTSRIMLTLTLSVETDSISSSWDRPLSMLLGFAINAVEVIPLLIMLRLYPQNNILQNAYFDAKWYGVLTVVIYEIYFIIQAGHTVGRFDMFVTTALSPRAGNVYFCVLIVLAAVYAVFMGFEGLTRAVGIFAVLLVLSLIAISAALIPEYEPSSVLPLFSADVPLYIKNAVQTAGYMPEIAAIAVLSNLVKGKSAGRFYIWLGITAVSCIILTVVPMLVLGQYTGQKLFPFYVVSTLARFGSLERVDALTVGLWALGMFVKTSLFLMLSDICLSHLISRKYRVWYIFAAAAVIAVTGGLYSENIALQKSSVIYIAELITGVLTMFVLPLTTLIFTKVKQGKAGLSSKE